jgi:hypothetical protein
MTSQIPDTFLYKGEEYELVGLSGEGLVTPQDTKQFAIRNLQFAIADEIVNSF